MNFDFSEEQEELRRQTFKYFEGQGRCKAARQVLDGAMDYDAASWKHAADMGWLGAAIPEDYGGVGLGTLELCVLAEEMGRAMTPIPFSSSICMAAEAIKRAGSDDQKKTYLPALAAGEKIGVLALGEVGKAQMLGVAECAVANGRVSGVKGPVADLHLADFAIISAKGEGDDGLYIVDLKATGVRCEEVEAIDLVRKHGLLTLENAPVEALGDPLHGHDLAVQILDIAAVLTAFEQLGGAEAAMHMALDYAKERHAFGRPVGGNQAVKHKLADMFVKNQLARSHAYYGAWALSSDAPELARAASGARLAAMDAFDFAAQECVEIHGGIGFTWESDCQFFYRRARLLGLNLGPKSYWTDRLVNSLHGRNR